MLFRVTFAYSPDDRNQVHARFKETGGAPPPEVEMLGRWHLAAGNGGFLIAKSDQADAVASWLQEWSDFVNFDVTPILSDEQFSEVIS
jgi:hypothetical protein